MEESTIIEAINNSATRTEKMFELQMSQIDSRLSSLETNLNNHKCVDIIQQKERLDNYIKRNDKFNGKVEKAGFFFWANMFLLSIRGMFK